MKVKSSKPKGQRMFKSIKFIHTNHCGKMKHKRPFWIEPIGKGWWFDYLNDEWYDGGYNSKRYSISYAVKIYGLNDIYSLRAAKRKIANWDVPKGTKFRVDLPFVGYNYIITK